MTNKEKIIAHLREVAKTNYRHKLASSTLVNQDDCKCLEGYILEALGGIPDLTGEVGGFVLGGRKISGYIGASEWRSWGFTPPKPYGHDNLCYLFDSSFHKGVAHDGNDWTDFNFVADWLEKNLEEID